MRHRQSSTGSFNASQRSFPKAIAAATLAGSLAGCSFTSPDAATGSQSVGIQGVTAQQARSIAREAYLYGTPMVASYQAMYAFSIDKKSPQYKGPFNTLNTIDNPVRAGAPGDVAPAAPEASASANISGRTSGSRSGGTSGGTSGSTSYSFAVLDLRAEPVVITVPPIEARRDFALQFMDLYTYRLAYIGSRSTGNGGGRFLVAAPRWKGAVPPGITQVIASETEFVTVVGRTQRFNAADQENIQRIQSRYKIQPLSAFTRKPATAVPAAVDWIDPVPPAQLRTSLEFYNELAFLLQFAPTHSTEKWLRERFASIGVRAGQPFDTENLNPALRRALQEGMHDGQNDIDKNRAALGGKTGSLFGDRATLKNDYLSRATGAQMGLGASGTKEALPAAPNK
ncbi:hypothetical protein D3C87_512280 [compost metagenome]|uniref:DUF1254 domain-containing protein n=1 Tax=Achromobacter sp. Root83 TaxID=1736602 RepID=UPI000708C9B2|nr:DUF1254 domain-containing protein [Achromobacter sp. Root83]KRC73128.1 cell envelope protein [Achromobacter sp. Root83]